MDPIYIIMKKRGLSIWFFYSTKWDGWECLRAMGQIK